ncbi:hypothetical protein M153_3120008791, partial [Pseudoloma neurophilia]
MKNSSLFSEKDKIRSFVERYLHSGIIPEYPDIMNSLKGNSHAGTASPTTFGTESALRVNETEFIYTSQQIGIQVNVRLQHLTRLDKQVIQWVDRIRQQFSVLSDWTCTQKRELLKLVICPSIHSNFSQITDPDLLLDALIKTQIDQKSIRCHSENIQKIRQVEFYQIQEFS